MMVGKSILGAMTCGMIAVIAPGENMEAMTERRLFSAGSSYVEHNANSFIILRHELVGFPLANDWAIWVVGFHC